MLDLGQQQKKLMIWGQRLVSMIEGLKGWRRCSRQWLMSLYFVYFCTLSCKWLNVSYFVYFVYSRTMYFCILGFWTCYECNVLLFLFCNIFLVLKNLMACKNKCITGLFEMKSVWDVCCQIEITLFGRPCFWLFKQYIDTFPKTGWNVCCQMYAKVEMYAAKQVEMYNMLNVWDEICWIIGLWNLLSV